MSGHHPHTRAVFDVRTKCAKCGVDPLPAMLGQLFICPSCYRDIALVFGDTVMEQETVDFVQEQNFRLPRPLEPEWVT